MTLDEARRLLYGDVLCGECMKVRVAERDERERIAAVEKRVRLEAVSGQ